MNAARGLAPVLAALLVLSLPAAALAAPKSAHGAPTQAVRVLSSLPHDASAFTEGFFLHRGVSFESTGLYGQSSVRRVDPATGRILARCALPARFFGEGLALCPETGRKARLIQLTWREGVILTYDPVSLRPLARFSLRGQGWGLACRGGTLVLSDGTDALRFLDARTLAETGQTLHVRDGARPVERLNELEWVNGWLVANIWQEDVLAVIRPDDGQVALWLDLSGLRRELARKPEMATAANGPEVANGVAFDPQADDGRGALLLTGKRWDRVFVAALPELLRRPPARSGQTGQTGQTGKQP
jgi:glutaminyl-peptide cyclotransferase